MVFLLTLFLLSPALFGGLKWDRDTIPATLSNPASSSIIAACNDGEIPVKEVFHSNDAWIPSTSVGCAPKSNGTVVLTLDDQSHLPTWWTYRSQIIDSGMKLTMFLDRSYHLNETEWYWLETFYADGHEIGIHGKDHLDITKFIEEDGTIQEYIDTQIIPEIETFNSHGIYPTAFSYPHGLRNSKTDSALLGYFNILRATNQQITNDHLPMIIPEYSNKVITAASMDREFDSRNYIEGLIQDAANSGMAVATYGHRLDPNENKYHTTEPEDLFAFANLAKSLGMRFGTISDLARPAHKNGLENMYQYMRNGDLQIANRMLENCWTLPRFDEVCLDGEYPSWHEDPFNENYWRFVFYSLRPLSHLLYAWETTGNLSYKNHMLEIIRTFSDADEESPWIYDHHADKHGAAFRAMILTQIRWVLDHDSALNLEEIALIESLMVKTGTYLMHPSNFESGYNHGFNQAAGLLVLSTNHPWLQDSLIWDQTARIRLKMMMEDAIDSDGVMIESSPYYHNYILIKIGDIIRWSDENDIVMPDVVSEMFPLMLDYATDVAYPDMGLPLIGASIPSLGINSNSFGSFENLHDRLAWIRTNGVNGTPGVEEFLFHTAFYPESGHGILRSSWSTEINDVSHVVIDAGPYRTSHSDYDHFGMTWFYGQEILVDPGLYSYEISEKRDYFHGTSAHNVILVDGDDQPEEYEIGQTSIFEENGWGGIVSTIHIDDWYWTRSVISIGNNTVLVYDEVESTSNHEFDILWHMAPDLIATKYNSGFSIQNEQEQIAQLQTISSRVLEEEIIQGQTEPLQGWVADGYESMIPAPVIRQSTSGNSIISASLWSSSNSLSSIDGMLSPGNSNLEINVSGLESTIHISQNIDGEWNIIIQS
jgi:peptidoglycan/xylan/chitin deacetylase (PgdA/CDA1 family)